MPACNTSGLFCMSLRTLHLSNRRSGITKDFDARLYIPDDDAAGPHKRPVPDGNPRDDARMASEKYTLSEDSAPVDAAMAADLAPISDDCVVRHVAERSNRYMIANRNVGGQRGERSQGDSGSKAHIAPNVRQRVNQVDESAASFDDGRIKLDLVYRISDRPDKNIVFLDLIAIHISNNPRCIVISGQSVRPVIEEPFDSVGSAGGDGLGGKGEDFAAHSPGADDDQVPDRKSTRLN